MEISKNELMRELCEFFLENFADDATGVAEWVGNAGFDIDDFVELAQRVRADLRKRTAKD